MCLVGHSFGGDTAIDVAEEVNEKGDGFEIELAVTLDAVSPGAHFEWQKDKPENVFYWFNVHVQWELDWNNIVAQTGRALGNTGECGFEHPNAERSFPSSSLSNV
ncbi:MAG: hypothetical protein R3C56_09055 [Pirellulaceae bacterium]